MLKLPLYTGCRRCVHSVWGKKGLAIGYGTSIRVKKFFQSPLAGACSHRSVSQAVMDVSNLKATINHYTQKKYFARNSFEMGQNRVCRRTRYMFLRLLIMYDVNTCKHSTTLQFVIVGFSLFSIQLQNNASNILFRNIFNIFYHNGFSKRIGTSRTMYLIPRTGSLSQKTKLQRSGSNKFI